MSSGNSIGWNAGSRDIGRGHVERTNETLFCKLVPGHSRFLLNDLAENPVHQVVIGHFRAKWLRLRKGFEPSQNFVVTEIAFHGQQIAADQTGAMAEQIAERGVL